MAIIITLIASFCVAVTNYCMRRSIDSGGTSRGFLVIQQFLALLTAFVMNPVRTGHYDINAIVVFLGVFAGVVLGAMMAFLGRALEKGPAALSFSILNMASVIPALLLAIIFGKPFGHLYHYWHGLGSFLVILGLLWAAKSDVYEKKKIQWFLFSMGTFVCHVLFLLVINWREMMLDASLPKSILIPFSLQEEHCQWFTVFIFIVSTSIQTFLFFKKDWRPFSYSEYFFGGLGGVFNGISMTLLILASSQAGNMEKAMIFPLFSIGIIVMCNLWGQLIYSEKIHWKANTLSILGLCIGTVDWTQVF